MRDRALLKKIDAFFESNPEPSRLDITQIRQTINDCLEESVSDQEILTSLESIKRESKHSDVVEFHVNCLVKVMDK